jgi:phosphoglycolate phosphatase-like HAD superfamily hydrolase
MKNYLELKLPIGNKAYVKKSSVELLEQVKSLIFDCDGVLIDASDSFIKAIIKTTQWYLTEIIGLGEINEDFITLEEISLFKNSGGFNNDWYLTYGVVLYFVTLLLIHLNNRKKELLALMKGNGNLKSKMRRLGEFGALCKSIGFDSVRLVSSRFGDWSLKEYAGSIDVRGLPSSEEIVKNKLAQSLGLTMDQASDILDKLCLYQGTVFDFNIIKRYFEEIYSGSEVFKNVYGVNPLFYKKSGLIENEKLIIKKEVLDNLILDLGFSRFGIASGRLRSQTLLVLQRYGNLERYFDLDSSIFLEDIMSAENNLRSKNINRSLEKPDPYSLLTVADKINPPRQIFGYVGDTVSDIIAAKRAQEQSKYSVLSIGVLCSASDTEMLIKKFLSLDADVILPSPNDLSPLFTNFEMMKNEKC